LLTYIYLIFAILRLDRFQDSFRELRYGRRNDDNDEDEGNNDNNRRDPGPVPIVPETGSFSNIPLIDNNDNAEEQTGCKIV
jgi:hypothetical protein